MTVRILHAADLHLGAALPYLGDTAASRRQDLLDTFDRLCDLAIQRRVDALLIAGDLFDSYNPPTALVTFVQSQLQRLTSSGVRAFAVPGNHDSIWHERSVWRKDAFAGLHLFDDATFAAPVSFTAGGVEVHVHGLAYSQTICPDPLSTLQHNEPGIHVGLMHATVDAPASVPAEERYFSISQQELFYAGMNYVALGHVHKGQAYELGGTIVAAYPGSPEGLDSSETGQRNVALIELDGSAARVLFIPVNGREIRRIRMDVTDCETEDVIQALLDTASDNVLLTARLEGAPRELLDTDEIKGRVAQAFFWLDVQDSTDMMSSELVTKIAGEATIAGQFASTLRTRMRGTQDPEERAMLDAALRLGLRALRQRRAS